jgi:copper(I)-binding protein
MPRYFAALCFAVLAGRAQAQDYHLGPLRIEQPWSRTPPQAPAAAVYFTLKNTGQKADTLLGVSTPRAGEAMLHQSMQNGNTMTMREADHGVALPPGAAVRFKPGGLHVMLMALKKPLASVERFPLTLHFANAGKITIQVDVSPNEPANR